MTARKKTKPKNSGKSGRQRQTGRSRGPAPGAGNQGLTLEQLAGWSFYECWISEEWRDPGVAVMVLVARSSGTGAMAVGSFLVDMGCLGLKDGFMIESDILDFREMREQMQRAQPLIRCEPEVALGVVLAAGEYGESLGFEQHEDAVDALGIFVGLDPDDCTTDAPVGGPDGKPLYVAGPDDDVEDVLATLDREVGSGEYDFVIGSEADPTS